VRSAWHSVLLGLLLAAPGARADDDLCSRLDLEEVAAKAGLDFVHVSGKSSARHLPESMGSGAAWLDYDGDGWLDLYLVQAGEFPPSGSKRSTNRLYRSLSGRAFEDVTLVAGVGDRGYGQGAVTGDLDGDGDPDLVVTNFGPDVILINRGNGSFERRDLENSADWSASAALADVDGDGDLDLYVTSYVEYDLGEVPQCFDTSGAGKRYCDPSLFHGAIDRLYLNDGDGFFADASASLPAAALSGRGLGVVMVDLDGDLAPEIYVANDLTPNTLLVNDGHGHFEDTSVFSGAAVNRQGRSEAGMGVAVADIDGDLDPDLAVTNFDVETNTLYENLGAGDFRDVSAIVGFGPPSLNLLGFGLVALDLDLDGDLDFWVANGHIFDRPNRDNTTHAQPSQVLINERGRFRAASCEAPWGEPLVARGSAAADYDNDGDADIVLQQNDRGPRLVANTSAAKSFVGLDILRTRSGSEAIGAVATLDSTGRRRRSWVTAGDSYQSASDRRQHFALVTDEVAQSIEITWRSGRRARYLDPPSNSYLRVVEPLGPSG